VKVAHGPASNNSFIKYSMVSNKRKMGFTSDFLTCVEKMESGRTHSPAAENRGMIRHCNAFMNLYKSDKRRHGCAFGSEI